LKLRRLAAVALMIVTGSVLIAPAAQASSVCYSVSVTVNGDSVVNEAACHDLP
jgi:hypothetical protein